MILTIVGGVEHAGINDGYALIKGGSLLLLHAYIGTFLHSLIILFRIKRLPKRGERRLFYAHLLSGSFLFVRLLYVVLDVFVKDLPFDLSWGSICVFGDGSVGGVCNHCLVPWNWALDD
jgi:hypothetical protein